MDLVSKAPELLFYIATCFPFVPFFPFSLFIFRGYILYIVCLITVSICIRIIYTKRKISLILNVSKYTYFISILGDCYFDSNAYYVVMWMTHSSTPPVRRLCPKKITFAILRASNCLHQLTLSRVA